MLRMTGGSTQSQHQKDSMTALYYIGLDVHEKSVSDAIKIQSGTAACSGRSYFGWRDS